MKIVEVIGGPIIAYHGTTDDISQFRPLTHFGTEKAARDRMDSLFNANRSELTFAVGQEVLLSTKNLSFKSTGTRKFLPRWIGPFTITERVGKSAYRLALLPSMRIHPIFQVSLLKPYRRDGQYQPRPPTVM